MPDEPQGEPVEQGAATVDVIAPPENTQAPPDTQEVTSGAVDTTEPVPAEAAAPPP